MTRYGFIGTGSMGSMLVRCLTGSGKIVPADIVASSKSGISARELAAKTGIVAVGKNRSVAETADILFICVKPLEVRGVISEIRNELDRDILLISIAGCVQLSDLEAWAGEKARCVRIIPSVTAEQHSGITLVAWGRGVRPEDKHFILDLLRPLGEPVEMDELEFEVCTNLTSCGPALIAAMMREFCAAAVRTGSVRNDVAEHLLKETMTGTARLLTDEGMTFDAVIERVATKGGSTEEGVKVLEARLPAVMDEVHEALFAKRRVVGDRVNAPV
jgi:pyrroline-5-carboxylate reductase